MDSDRGVGAPQTSSQIDFDKVTEAYQRYFAKPLPMRICAGCGSVITEDNRISDGADYWHTDCYEGRDQ